MFREIGILFRDDDDDNGDFNDGIGDDDERFTHQLRTI